MCLLTFDEPVYLTPGMGLYQGSHAEVLGWRLLDYETLNFELAAAASGEASAAGAEGMSLGGRDAT